MSGNMKKISINTLASSPERERKIKEAVLKHGYEPVFIEQPTFDPMLLADSEIIFGAMPPEYMNEAKALKWFQCTYAGVDKFIASKVFEGRDLFFTKASGAYGVSIAEHMFGQILTLFRRFREYHEKQKNHHWQLGGEVRAIYGSRVVVLGLGDIGSNLARRLKSFGAYVIGVRRTESAKPEYLDELFTSEQLDEAVKGAQVLALCMPATDKTRHIIGRKQFELVSRDCVMLNVGRGAVIDQEALIDALYSGLIAGAALDVTTPEPLPSDSGLWDAPNTFITPHASGNHTLKLNYDLVVDIFIDNLERYVHGRPMTGIVDLKEQY
jgi:phosphoglycerate dehydrogenase-like enzyme